MTIVGFGIHAAEFIAGMVKGVVIGMGNDVLEVFLNVSWGSLGVGWTTTSSG